MQVVVVVVVKMSSLLSEKLLATSIIEHRVHDGRTIEARLPIDVSAE
jgi:hypothetical protein